MFHAFWISDIGTSVILPKASIIKFLTIDGKVVVISCSDVIIKQNSSKVIIRQINFQSVCFNVSWCWRENICKISSYCQLHASDSFTYLIWLNWDLNALSGNINLHSSTCCMK